ncbi:hypothetical protein GGF31_000226 [Allomyces arbusculus]|nr:hypothetical protein GGF31_000226 [Allomyces arbusculus]
MQRWPPVPVPDAPGVSLFQLVHRAFQVHCSVCNEPRFPNTLMPYGADQFDLVCRLCRFDQLLRALRAKNRATLATLSAAPFVGWSEATCFGAETVQYLGLPARALIKTPFDTVYGKNQRWVVYPVCTVQLVCHACTGLREPMDPFRAPEARPRPRAKRRERAPIGTAREAKHGV